MCGFKNKGLLCVNLTKCMQNADTGKDHIIPIHPKGDQKFLNDVFPDFGLPFGILDKGRTGCGGTTVAIESPHNYIIFMPTIELIKNKLAKYNKSDNNSDDIHIDKISLQGVYGSFVENTPEINQYIQEQHHYSKPVKILATYNSAPKLSALLGDSFYTEYFILVDEMHSLMTDYGFRSSAIEKLLSILINHKNVTYMSATPIAPKNGPKQLESLPRYEIIWPKKINRRILLSQSKNPLCSLIELILYLSDGKLILESGHKEEQVFPNQFFFYLNGVKQINSVLKRLPEKMLTDVNIVCTENDTNNTTLGCYTKLIGSTTKLKRFNFLTRKAFVGCDIYSPLGISILITDVKVRTNILDPQTDILQILGRIRNQDNPFKNYLIHYTNKLLPKQVDISSEIQPSEYMMNAESENTFRYSMYQNSVYYKYYSVLHSYYEMGMSAELGNFFDMNKDCTLNQRELLKNIYNIFKKGGNEKDFSPLQKALWDQNPEIKKAIKLFGIGKIKSLSFKLEMIRKFIKNENPKLKAKIAYELNARIVIGNIYSRKEIKLIISEIYQKVGIGKNAKAPDIERFYKVVPFTKYGKPNVSSYRIIEAKPIDELCISNQND